jgi:hypothetical protein
MTSHRFANADLAKAAEIATRYGIEMKSSTAVPASTGIGAPGNGPGTAAPADLARSPMSAAPGAQASAVPFPRASTLAVMQDKFLNAMTAGQSVPVTLQTNAFLAAIILDVFIVGTNTSATVKWNQDGPFNIFGASGIALSDPANQAIITPISGFKLAQLNKYLTDTDCNFDVARDPGFFMLPTAANNGTGSTATNAGSARFRLVVPVELRRRDAFGALTNSAANEAMILTLTPAASYAAGTDTQNNVYATAPDGGIVLNVSIFQVYWTAPPATIQSGGTSTSTQRTPAGLGTMGFVRSERHTDVSGGGSPLFQLTSVGDVFTNIVWTLRTSTNNQRDQWAVSASFNAQFTNWPPVFNFAVNDFTTLSLGQDLWIREIGRFYGLWNGISNQAGNPGYMDGGVWTFGPYFSGIFDEAVNFLPASQYLATTAQTKCQVRGSTFGSGSAAVEVDVRVVRPQSGQTLYA